MNASTMQTKTEASKSIRGTAGKIAVLENGHGGTPVLFIHSFGGSTAQWKNQMQYLKTKTIAMDLRGHGNSDTPADHDYGVDSMMKDVETVVDSLQLTKLMLVGHSIGGSIAIAYAGKHPDKVAGLFITGTPGKTPEEQARPIIASLESENYASVMDQYMKKLLTNATAETNKLESDGMKKIDKKASINIIKSVFSYDPLPAFKKYDGPKLLVFTENDESPNSLHKAFPDVPYKSIGGTSHWIQLDKPEEFSKILHQFVTMVEDE